MISYFHSRASFVALCSILIATSAVSAQDNNSSYYNDYFNDTQCVHCPEYVASSAAEKEGIIMAKIINSEYETVPELKGICDVDFDWRSTVDFNNQFDRFSDERSPGMKRFFHLQNAVASVKFESSNNGHGFTGIFRGADSGVFAFSPLAPLLTNAALVNNFIGTFPVSFGLKLFRDSLHSANILAADSNRTLGAYGESRNFWDLPDFNILSRPTITLSGIGDNGPIFGTKEKFSGVLSTADAAAYTGSGEEELNPKAPLILHFEPNPMFKEQFGKVGELNFRKWLRENEDAFQEGTLLYTVYTTVDKATKDPSLCVDDKQAPLADEDVSIYCPDQDLVKLGEVVLTSRFYSSQWSDDKLFFQHTRICPKDQSTCENVNPETLTAPYPSFAQAGDDSVTCVSDDNQDGEVTGLGPDCPEGSQRVADYCYPGNHKKVEATQINQCPFMQSIDPYILGTTDVEPNTGDCSTWGQVQNNALGSTVGAISGVIRWWENIFG